MSRSLNKQEKQNPMFLTFIIWNKSSFCSKILSQLLGFEIHQKLVAKLEKSTSELIMINFMKDEFGKFRPIKAHF